MKKPIMFTLMLAISRLVALDVYGAIIALLGVNLVTPGMILKPEFVASNYPLLIITGIFLIIFGGCIVACRKILEKYYWLAQPNGPLDLDDKTSFQERFMGACGIRGYVAAIIFLLSTLFSASALYTTIVVCI